MKKVFLFILFGCAMQSVKSQMALNEVYVRPGNGQSEFFEIYNNAKTNININLDCFSALTYWKDNVNSRGWYVLDFGPTAIPPSGYFTAASSSPFNTQNSTNISAGLNWNALPPGASLTKWELNTSGNGYNQLAISSNLDNYFEDINGIGMKNIILLYKQSSFAQGFLAASGSNTLPAEIISMPPLTVSTAGACTSETFSFAGVSGSPFLYFANPAAGNDNGYSRLFDGNCAPWDKSAPGNDHTANTTNNNQGNGGASPYDGTIVTSQVLLCLTQTSSRINYDVTGVTGAATEANSFPVKVEFFTDLGTIGQYDPGVDILIATQTQNTVAEPFSMFNINSGSPQIIMLYTTANGCYDKVYSLTSSCITLPVNFKFFTAVRNKSNVLLKWETSSEQNSSGFALERNIGNNNWQQIVFVSTQAIDGNSSTSLLYQYADLNTTKGISQYRIRQIDIDSKSRLSEIRSVRGDGQSGKTLLYPNPSTDGKVNIVFEEKNVTRDIAIADMSGRVVKQLKNVISNNVSIENLVSGMYSIRILSIDTGEVMVEKVVVNRR